MKKIQFPFAGKSLVLLLLSSFMAVYIIQAQSTNLLPDKNNDCVSDNLPHQFLNLYQNASMNSKDTGDVVHSIPTPGYNCQGLTWVDNYLWCSDIEVGKIYQVDPVDGDIIQSFDSPAYFIEGMAWDGNYLWASDNGGGAFVPGQIYKIDLSNGSVFETLEPAAPWVHGITWDGQYIWMNDFSTHTILKVDPLTGNSLQSFAAPGGQCIGLTWDGSHLWTDDFGTDKLYCINPEDGSIIFELNSPHTNPRDMAWDGEYLWVLAAMSSTIYQVDVGYTTSIDELDLSTSNIEALTVYPNPMEASATISYTLKEKENIQIDLYNSNGVLIRALVQATQLKGDYQFKIDTENLVAGVYYCVFQSGQKSIVKKVVKIR